MTENEINLHGDHETQVSEGGEADLHCHLTGCKKNPGHANFIPVETFTLNHLPDVHRDNDLYELIKAAADLTVRVAVNITSQHRPEFWPNTQVSYPFYNMRGKTHLRTGSGWVSEVDRSIDINSDNYGEKDRKCWCKKCQHSSTPSSLWWEFDVVTATHVVFDDIEANHTSLRLFYDNEESPLVIVDQVNIGDKDINRDWCLLHCVTCETNLSDKLKILRKHFDDLSWKVCEKYFETREVDKLNFIASHPHGCSKQISVGHWEDKYKVDKLYKFTYKTCTCPGSSGARVHCVGYKDGWWTLNQFVHTGSLNSNLNYSGNGMIF